MKTTRSLMVKLTEGEIWACSAELARITAVQAELEDEKKAVNSAFKDRIDRCVADSRSLARKITTKQELRDVDCEWVRSNVTMVLYRNDTGEQIEERAMTPEELQENLPLKEGSTK